MMQQPLQTCPHCGKPVSPGISFCPHCGTALGAVPPVPMLGMNAALDSPLLWTGSRKKDIGIGIALGLGAPLVIPLFITALYYLNANTLAGILVPTLGLFGQVLLPLLASYHLKKKYPVAGDAMMKTILFEMAACILLVLGVLMVCLIGIVKP